MMKNFEGDKTKGGVSQNLQKTQEAKKETSWQDERIKELEKQLEESKKQHEITIK